MRQQAENAEQDRRDRGGMQMMIMIPLLIFLLDTVIKYQVDRRCKSGEKKSVCGGRLMIQKYYNKGAALNFLAEKPKLMTAIHTVILSAAAGIYAVLLREKGSTGLKVSFGMVLGGGCSNLFDRLRKKHVVDYVSFNVPFKRLKNIVFNISDFFIFAGVIFSVLFGCKRR